MGFCIICRDRIKKFIEDSSDSGEDSLTLDRCNGFMRRLLYQEVPKQFGDSVYLETCDESNFVRFAQDYKILILKF